MRAMVMAGRWQGGGHESSARAFGPERRGGRRGIVWPRMLGGGAAHILGDISPASGPETGQVLRRLDRPAGRRSDGERQRNLAIAQHRMLGQSEKRLRPDVDDWA